MKERLQIAIRAWLRELHEPTPAPERIAKAAQQVAQNAAGSEEMRRLVAAIRSDIEDHLDCTVCQERLPEFIAAQFSGGSQLLATAPMIEVRDHLSLCLYCAGAYAQVSEWMSAGEIDAIPTASSYPSFEVPASSISHRVSQPSMSNSNFAGALRSAAAQGRRWLEDTRGGLYLVFGQGLLPSKTWAIKSGEEGKLLAQTVVDQEEVEGWEVEASAFADTPQSSFCRLEVAIFRPGAPNAVMAGILVAIDDGVTTMARLTDAAGIAEFFDVPIERLAETVVQIQLPQ